MDLDYLNENREPPGEKLSRPAPKPDYRSVNDLAYAAFVTAKFGEIGVPCVLWGDSLLQLWGRSSELSSEDLSPARLIEFVVPDNDFEKASQHLSTLPGLVPCAVGDRQCDRVALVSSFRLHAEGLECVHVFLHKQSETIWFLPPMEETLGPCQYCPDQKLPEQFIRGSIPDLRIHQQNTSKDVLPHPTWLTVQIESLNVCYTGRITTPEGDIVVGLQSHVMVEAFIRCYLLRDPKKMTGDRPSNIFLYDHNTSRLERLKKVQFDHWIDPEKLSPIFKAHWIKFCCHGQGFDVDDWEDDLRKDLGLPPIDHDHPGLKTF